MMVLEVAQIILSDKSNRISLRWRHNDHSGVSNHQPDGCLLNRLFRRKSKKTSKLRVTGLCAGNSPGTGEFPAQMASYAENVSIWWRHHFEVVPDTYGGPEGTSLHTFSIALHKFWLVWKKYYVIIYIMYKIILHVYIIILYVYINILHVYIIILHVCISILHVYIIIYTCIHNYQYMYI